MLQIRDVQPEDLEAVLALNRVEEQHTSVLDLDRLRELHLAAHYHRAALVEGCVSGFLLAFGAEAAYDSPNFQWFVARYPAFIYIDRVVVSHDAKGQGIGRALYKDLFSVARGEGVSSVTCEINVVPPNPGSMVFHARMGFEEVGTFTSPMSGKTFSMQLITPGE